MVPKISNLDLGDFRALSGRILTAKIPLLIFSLLMASVTALPNGSSRMPEFELKDQYGQSLAYKFPSSKVTVLVFGDRQGAEQIEGWVRPLYEKYRDQINIRGVAVLSSVPAFMRPMVRGIFKSRVKYPVLLDWEGGVSRNYDYQSKRANVFVISQSGELLLKLVGASNASELERIQAQIDRQIQNSSVEVQNKVEVQPRTISKGRQKK